MMYLLKIQMLMQMVSYPGYIFHVGVDNENGVDIDAFLQAEFIALDTTTGLNSKQKTRKWQLSQHMTKSELVQTALKCVLTSLEHEAREQFKYKGQAVFGPHFDVDKLYWLALTEHEDARAEKEAGQ